MTLDDLLNAKLISKREYFTYQLFNTEIGKEWIKDMINETYMDSASFTTFTGEAFAFADGRRSIMRDILMIQKRIEQLISEVNHGREPTTTRRDT